MNNEKVCYCFNYTKQDIQEDFHKHGRSAIMDRIVDEKRDGNCECESTNPKGR